MKYLVYAALAIALHLPFDCPLVLPLYHLRKYLWYNIHNSHDLTVALVRIVLCIYLAMARTRAERRHNT